jgi:hypothetical protein
MKGRKGAQLVIKFLSGADWESAGKIVKISFLKIIGYV